MNINERLQEIEENTIKGNTKALGFQRISMHREDYQWMHDTIKQLQEDVEFHEKYKIQAFRSLDKQQQRIAELEKERREITAAHEEFLHELQLYTYGDDTGAHALERIYNKHFQFIHLAEQVRLAKLSAGVDGE